MQSNNIPIPYKFFGCLVSRTQMICIAATFDRGQAGQTWSGEIVGDLAKERLPKTQRSL